MSFTGELTKLHVRLDRLIGPHAFDEPAIPQRSQGELSCVLYAALVAILVVAVLAIAATGMLVE
jgi:hypothetical protein